MTLGGGQGSPSIAATVLRRVALVHTLGFRGVFSMSVARLV